MAAFDHLETYTEPKELISIFQHKGDLGSAKRERRDLKRGSKEVRSRASSFGGSSWRSATLQNPLRRTLYFATGEKLHKIR